ncbi:hypothetical protein ACFL0D_04255 [Thermoproteota archaeon]
MSSSKFFYISEKGKQKIYLITLAVVLGSILVSYTVSLFAFISPTADLRWETSVIDFDQLDYSRGESVTLTGFLEEGTQYFNVIQYYYFLTGEPVTWAVIVMDPNNMPIHIYTDTISDLEGDLTLDPLSFNIPTSASLGTYKVRIMVWTDLLPTGVTRTKTINEGSFEVVP